MKKKNIVIAIDGTAGSGKSTLAKDLAQKLGYLYIDTGAMYRAIAYQVLRDKLDLKNEKAVIALAKRCSLELNMSGRIYLNGRDVSRKIRMPRVSDLVSKVAAIKGVRQEMVKQQRLYGKDHNVVIEGRDIGTVVFPKAEIKFFLVAEVNVRSKRRFKELTGKRIKSNIQEVQENIINRDIKDSSRKVSPLRPAKDAMVMDTTNLTIKRKNDLALKYIRERIEGR